MGTKWIHGCLKHTKCTGAISPLLQTRSGQGGAVDVKLAILFLLSLSLAVPLREFGSCWVPYTSQITRRSDWPTIKRPRRLKQLVIFVLKSPEAPAVYLLRHWYIFFFPYLLNCHYCGWLDLGMYLKKFSLQIRNTFGNPLPLIDDVFYERLLLNGKYYLIIFC